MSARSVRRNHARLLEDARRRNARRAKRAGLAAGAALGATVLFAPAAQAANFEVNTLSDDPGNCADGNVGTCTLREAVNVANTTAGDDTITFADSLSGTIRLISGQIDISGPDALTITDSGPNRVVISGDAEPLGPEHGDTRIFSVGTTAKATLTGLTITEGYADGGGGAINVSGNNEGEGGTLTVNDSTISGSTASSNGGAIRGGKYASITINDSTISGNTAGGDGGGIYSDKYNLLEVSNSTISGNTAGQDGGGISFLAYHEPEMEEPPAAEVAEQIRELRQARAETGATGGSTATFENTTIASNVANADEGSGAGGGIFLESDSFRPPISGLAAAAGAPTESETIVLSSTIVADNEVAEEAPVDSAETGAQVSNDLAQSDDVTEGGGFELISSLVETPGAATVTQNPAGSSILGQDPALGALASNGGTTQTHLPAPTSPAVDAGIANALTDDQRELARTVDRPPVNAANSDGTDIGSVEIQADPPPVVIPDQPKPTPLRDLPDGCGLPLVPADAGLRIAGDPAGQTTNGSDGNDIIRGFNGNDTINGRPGDDCLTGDNDDDAVNGEDGNDFGRGGSGVDTMTGGPGDDDFGSGGGNDDVDLGTGDDRGVAGGGEDKVTGDTGKDLIRGRAGDDNLKGDEGGDNVKGGRDNDEMSGGEGKDDLRGGFGDDVIKGGPDADKIDCGKGQDTAIADPEDDVSKDCETVK